jgi:Tfp pilus assembly protein PilF
LLLETVFVEVPIEGRRLGAANRVDPERVSTETGAGMSRSRLRAAAWLAIVATVCTGPLLAGDSSGTGRIELEVRDPGREPVVGATIRLWPAADPSATSDQDWTTDRRGRFKQRRLGPGTWIVRVSAAGFEPWQRSIEIAAGPAVTTLAVELDPKPQLLEVHHQAEATRRYQRAQELAAAGRYPEARAEYEGALERLEPENRPTVMLAIAATYMEEGDLDRAEGTLERVLAVDPDHGPALHTLLGLVASEGRTADAEALLARIPADQPVSPTTLINIALAHSNAGKLLRARSFLDRAVVDHPEVAAVYYWRAVVSLDLGESEAARADLVRFLEIDPDDPRAADARRRLEGLTPDRSEPRR